MAVSELGGIAEIEGWAEVRERALPVRFARGTWYFARKKPLGFVCGLIVLFFMIIGDLVPESANKVVKELNNLSSLAGIGDNPTSLGDSPVPYLADVLEKHTGIIHPYQKQDIRHRLDKPFETGQYILGTDPIGRDVLSRLFYGARVAVVVAFGATFVASVLGAGLGISFAYYGGWLDKYAYRVVDVFQALPGLVIYITILGVFGSGLWQLVFVLGGLTGPLASRVNRGQAIQIMASPFIEAARVMGASDRRIMVRYLLPNVFPLIILGATLGLGGFVLAEATLSFLGYGLPPPFPSWGQMLQAEGRNNMLTAPGLAIFPGLAIATLVFSFNLVGDALRDVLDPRLRGSR